LIKAPKRVYKKTQFRALSVHLIAAMTKGRASSRMTNLLKCRVVKWISAKCVATEGLALQAHGFGLTPLKQ
jgi:hypothetical protein